MEVVSANPSDCNVKFAITVLYAGKDLKEYFSKYVTMDIGLRATLESHSTLGIPVNIDKITNIKNRYKLEISYVFDKGNVCNENALLWVNFWDEKNKRTKINETSCCESTVSFTPVLSQFLCFEGTGDTNECLDLATYQIYMNEPWISIIGVSGNGVLKYVATKSLNCTDKTYIVRGLTVYSDRGPLEVPVDYSKRVDLSDPRTDALTSIYYQLVCDQQAKVRNAAGIGKSYEELKSKLGYKTIPVPDVVRRFR